MTKERIILLNRIKGKEKQSPPPGIYVAIAKNVIHDALTDTTIIQLELTEEVDAKS